MSQEKKFELPEIIVLLMLAIVNDILTVVVDFVFAFPIVGQILGVSMEAVNAGIWAAILLWFIMKLGFKGEVGVLQVAGGIAEFVGIPARTFTVGAGIYLTNNPRAAKLVKVAEIATLAVATEGASLAVEGAAAGAEAGVATGAAVEGVAAGQAAAGTGAEAAKGLSAAEKASQAAKEQEEVFGGTTAGPVEEAGEKMVGKEPMEEAAKPEEEISPSEKERPSTKEIAEKIKENLPEEEENEDEESAPGEQALAEQLGGAYKEEKEIMETMTEGISLEGAAPGEVDAEAGTNTVNLREDNIAGGGSGFGQGNTPKKILRKI